MKKNFFFFAMFLLLLGISCTKNVPAPDINTLVLYSNSFENDADTIGWEGYCSVYFTENAPEGGANRSVSVSCGCIVPHESFKIGPFDEDKRLVVSCMARGFYFGGNLSLSYGDMAVGFTIPADSTWRYFESLDTLFVPANEDVRLNMSAGGFAAGMIELDLLEVKAVE